MVNYLTAANNEHIIGIEITLRDMDKGEHSEAFHSTDRNVVTVTQAQIGERVVPYFSLYNCRLAIR